MSCYTDDGAAVALTEQIITPSLLLHTMFHPSLIPRRGFPNPASLTTLASFGPRCALSNQQPRINAGTQPSQNSLHQRLGAGVDNQHSARDQRVNRRKSALPPTPAINHLGNPAAVIGLLLTRSKAGMETRSNYQP